MDEDSRVPFDEAVRAFRRFMVSQRQGAGLIWITRERSVSLSLRWPPFPFPPGRSSRLHTLYVFRPAELEHLGPPRTCYESIRATDRNIALLAIGPLGGRTVAYVARGWSDSRMLNLTCLVEMPRIRAVHSALVWRGLQWLAAALRSPQWVMQDDAPAA
jgi:hypothetical protein